MTLVAAWLRTSGGVRELVIAADSRLRGGYAWDCAPKIVPMPRGDCAIAFAGETGYAYPLLTQVANANTTYERALNRHMDLPAFEGHIVRTFNKMLDSMGDLPKGHQAAPDVAFLLGGFDWRAANFRLVGISYDPERRRFRKEAIRMPKIQTEGKRFVFLGDHTDEAKSRLIERVRARGAWPKGSLDMDPLHVIADMAGASDFPTIGGVPQVVKIYRSVRVVPFVVELGDERSYLGRPLLKYEQPDLVPRLLLNQDAVEMRPAAGRDED